MFKIHRFDKLTIFIILIIFIERSRLLFKSEAENHVCYYINLFSNNCNGYKNNFSQNALYSYMPNKKKKKKEKNDVFHSSDKSLFYLNCLHKSRPIVCCCPQTSSGGGFRSGKTRSRASSDSRWPRTCRNSARGTQDCE